MKLIEWEVNEDNYQEQIVIPEAQRKLAESEGISTESKQKIAVRIQNLNTGELYSARIAITGNRQLYLPKEIQKITGRCRVNKNTIGVCQFGPQSFPQGVCYGKWCYHHVRYRRQPSGKRRCEKSVPGHIKLQIIHNGVGV